MKKVFNKYLPLILSAILIVSSIGYWQYSHPQSTYAAATVTYLVVGGGGGGGVGTSNIGGGGGGGAGGMLTASGYAVSITSYTITVGAAVLMILREPAVPLRQSRPQAEEMVAQVMPMG